MIVYEDCNEVINAKLQFRVITNLERYDKIYDTYSKAKERIETLKRIFQFSFFNIIVEEKTA